jgi:hypothetical protein
MPIPHSGVLCELVTSVLGYTPTACDQRSPLDALPRTAPTKETRVGFRTKDPRS